MVGTSRALTPLPLIQSMKPVIKNSLVGDHAFSQDCFCFISRRSAAFFLEPSDASYRQRNAAAAILATGNPRENREAKHTDSR
jgi:hypothetical protein